MYEQSGTIDDGGYWYLSFTGLACADLIYAAPDEEDVIQQIESRNGGHILEHAEAIGFGTRQYELVSID